MRRRVSFLGVIWLLLAACWPVPGLAFEHGRLEVATADGRRLSFAIELARTPGELAQGLMHRPSLAADAGMLFDFGHPQRVSMWMKDTLIPLDMLFAATDGRIVAIAKRTVPHSLDTVSAPGPVLAVLELNSGTAERLGIAVGDRLDHPMFRRK